MRQSFANPFLSQQPIKESVLNLTVNLPALAQISFALKAELFERPKRGFSLPLDQWLRGPLRPWVEELLDPTTLRRQGVFNPAPVAEAWKEHLDGRNRAPKLWGILMFQAWQQKWM